MSDDLSKPCVPCLVQVPVTVNSNTAQKPTARIILLEPLPQIVEVKADLIPETSNPETTDAEIVLSLHDGTFELPDEVALWPVKAPIGRSDIILAMNKGLYDKLQSLGLNTWEAVSDAVVKNGVYPDLHNPTGYDIKKVVLDDQFIELEVPDVLDSVVTVTEQGRLWKISSTDKVSLGDHLFAVVSPGEQPDIIVAASLDFVSKHQTFEYVINYAIKQTNPVINTLPILKPEVVPDLLKETRKNLINSIKSTNPDTPKRARKKSVLKTVEPNSNTPNID